MLQTYKIADYIQEYQPVWACEMPDGCPPGDVCIAIEHSFFRLTENSETYSPTDFLSYAEINPKRAWGDMLPLAVGLSLIDNEAKARRNLKLPIFRGYKGIAKLVLQPQDGVVKQTGNHNSHYTWWRTKSFVFTNLQMLSL